MIIGCVARKKYFESFFHAMSAAGAVTIISMSISTIINLLLLGGSTGNIWGDGVRDYLIFKGAPQTLSLAVGQLYLEFTDKLVTILGMYVFIKLVRFFRSFSPAAKNTTCLMIVCAVFCGTSISVSAESDTSYIRTIYNGDNGLECGHANDVAQTNDGILWVGSYSGLYRYNGNTFKFMNEFDLVKNVNCLFVDSEGRLWIGTNDNGVVVAINENIVSSMDSNGGLPSASVRCITQGANGEYYIGTSDSMVIVRLKTDIYVDTVLDDIRYAKKAAADKNGNVAVVTADGKLHIFRNSKEVYEIKAESEGINFACCTFDPSGMLWVGTTDGTAIAFTVGENGAEKTAEIDCEGLSGVNSIYYQNDSVNWVLSDNGVGMILDKKEYMHLETEGFNYSLENMTIDYQGNLWIASSRMGLMRLSTSPFTDVFGDCGIEACVVNTTALKDDIMYVGTDNGLIIIDRKANKQVENKLTETLSEARIRCIKNDSKGNLWICTYGKGLVEVKSDGTFLLYDNGDNSMGSRVRVCMELSDGSIAVGGDKGLHYIENDSVKDTIPYDDDFGAAKILTLYEMNDGTLLAGTDGNGIVVIKNRRISDHLQRDDGLTSGVIFRMVCDIGEKNSDNVFIAAGNGLCYLDSKNGFKIRSISNFPYSNNYDIILDQDGDMFVSGSSGIYVLNRDNLMSEKNFKYTVLNSRAGLRGALTSNAWNAIDDQKNIYLSTDRGVFAVNMDLYKIKRKFYKLMISEILLDGTAVNTKRGSSMSISKDVNSIEIVPEIVNYTLDNPNISYYLEGLDHDWKTVPQNELSHIVYTNLPSGEYVFRLAILDPENGNVLEENTYSFKKEKAIYDNSWFMVYMIVVGVIFIGWLTWYLTRTKTQRTMEIQQAKLSLALQQVKMGNETILAIAKTVDAKDVRTSKHSQRVSDYAVMIARKCGFSEKELENLRKAALLHDIGKIGIPDAILNKPSRLTDEEYKIMKTHVIRGAEILKDFTLVDHVVDGARYHHERYDGNGYPDKLSGKDIPLYGRIIAIADAFDAMTANRVYRKQQDFDYVMKELHNGRGTQFDPELLDIFLELIETGEIDINLLYSKKGDENDDGTE